MSDRFYLGVDVGTGSARAGIFDGDGSLRGLGKHPIDIFRETGDVVEQSSANIWEAVRAAVGAAMAEADLSAEDIAGIGFDATCSLVVLDAEGAPLSVSPTGDASRNVIVWMDHRATDQARRINAINHSVLRYVGGRVSPEMEAPKLLWLKENLSKTYDAAAHFMDLADFLTWRATGSLSRSSCTVTCKWNYVAHKASWDRGYFEEIGLGDLAADGFKRIGTSIVDAGAPLASGLTKAAAGDLGLLPGTAVAAGLIDAHAGGVGTVGGKSGPGSITTRLAYIFGTSACTMASTAEPSFVPGVWGPYFSAMVPGLWLNEGGQSAAGATLDHLIAMHPARDEAAAAAAKAGLTVQGWLTARALDSAETPSQAARLAGSAIVVPDFNGNRAPLADPDARGIITGLGLEDDINSLVRLFVAGISGIAFGLRHILETQANRGVFTEAIVISGGAASSDLVTATLADVTGVPVLLPATDEPVLLGAAMLGAVAAGKHPDLSGAMSAMTAYRGVVQPDDAMRCDYHDRRYEVYCLLQKIAGMTQRPL